MVWRYHNILWNYSLLCLEEGLLRRGVLLASARFAAIDKSVHSSARLIVAACGALLFGAAPSLSAQTTYAVEPLGVRITDGHASALTHSGALVGYSSFLEVQSYQAFRWSKGRLTSLDVFKYDLIPAAINESGQIVGNYFIGRRLRSFLFSKGRFISLFTATDGKLGTAADINDAGHVIGTHNSQGVGIYDGKRLRSLVRSPAFRSYQPRALNNADQIVGTGFTTFGLRKQQAFLCEKGAITNLGGLGRFEESFAVDIASNGAVALNGLTANSTALQAHLYQNGTFTKIGPLNGENAVARGINRHPAVVGSAHRVGFVWADGEIHDLNALISPHVGVTITDAFAINDDGVITAASDDSLVLLRPQRSGAPPPRLIYEGPLRLITDRVFPVIRGRAAGEVVSISYSPATASGHYAIGKGKRDWEVRPHCRPGLNVVQIFAHGPGGESRPLTLTITRTGS